MQVNTLTELRQATHKIIAAIERGKTVMLTDHGKPKAKIVPVTHQDYEGAKKALLSIGPVHFRPRK